LSLSNTQSFSQCNCPDTSKQAQPILESLKDLEHSDSLSYAYLANVLDKNITKDSISERFHNVVIFKVNADGYICDVSYMQPISKEAQDYIQRALTPLYALKFHHTCFSFSLALTIDDMLFVSDMVYVMGRYSPVIEGCPQSLDKKESNICMEKQIQRQIYGHSLYSKLGINSMVIVEFVITKTGEITLFKFKRKSCDTSILKKILTDAKWTPGKNSKGEPVNISYVLPLKPMH
jgi:hypothetical protein